MSEVEDGPRAFYRHVVRKSNVSTKGHIACTMPHVQMHQGPGTCIQHRPNNRQALGLRFCWPVACASRLRGPITCNEQLSD